MRVSPAGKLSAATQPDPMEGTQTASPVLPVEELPVEEPPLPPVVPLAVTPPVPLAVLGPELVPLDEAAVVELVEEELLPVLPDVVDDALEPGPTDVVSLVELPPLAAALVEPAVD